MLESQTISSLTLQDNNIYGVNLVSLHCSLIIFSYYTYLMLKIFVILSIILVKAGMLWLSNIITASRKPYYSLTSIVTEDPLTMMDIKSMLATITISSMTPNFVIYVLPKQVISFFFLSKMQKIYNCFHSIEVTLRLSPKTWFVSMMSTETPFFFFVISF
jgi:hypothetical protein